MLDLWRIKVPVMKDRESDAMLGVTQEAYLRLSGRGGATVKCE